MVETRLQSRHVPSCLHGASWRSAFVGFPYGDVIIGLALTGLFALSFTGAWFQAPIYGCPSPFPCGLPPGSAPEVCALMLVDQPCARGFPFGSLWEGTGLLPAVASVAALMFFVLRRMPRIELVRPISSVIGIIVAVIEVAVLLVSGVEPALLLAASVVLFLALRAVRVENIPAASESAVWMAFAAVESAFLLLCREVGVSFFAVVPSWYSYPLRAFAATPGGAFLVAAWLVAGVGVGGAARFITPSLTTRGAH